MLDFKQIQVILAVCLAVSCSHSGVVRDAAVKLAGPEKVVSVEPDTTFRCGFSEVLNCIDIRIVNDTILVFQDQVGETNPYHFKAYSTKSFRYLGAFARNGRGPGEMISPRMVTGNADENYLNLKDNSSGNAYIVDVVKSIETGGCEAVQSYILPSGTAEWFPLSDSEHFILQEENGEMVFHTISPDGTVRKTFNMYKGLDSSRYATYLSSILANNGKTGVVAEVMIFFPQINLVDTRSGQVRTIAVSKSYRKWESVMNGMFNMDTEQYYVCASSTSEYIFAVYKGVPLRQLNSEDGHGTSIHVFDWEGNFLYDVKLTENIGNIAMDSRTGYLYCTVMPDNRIVRYNLGELL